MVCGVKLYGSLPYTARSVWKNYGEIFGVDRYLCDPWVTNVLTEISDEVYKNNEHIFKKRNNVRPTRCYRTETRCVDRNQTIPVKAHGKGGVMLINQLAFDYAEV
jgi:hypothetical protein